MVLPAPSVVAAVFVHAELAEFGAALVLLVVGLLLVGLLAPGEEPVGDENLIEAMMAVAPDGDAALWLLASVVDPVADEGLFEPWFLALIESIEAELDRELIDLLDSGPYSGPDGEIGS